MIQQVPPDRVRYQNAYTTPRRIELNVGDGILNLR